MMGCRGQRGRAVEVEGTLTLEPAVVRVTLQQPTAHRLLTGDHICRLSLIKPVGLLSCPPARARARAGRPCGHRFSCGLAAALGAFELLAKRVDPAEQRRQLQPEPHAHVVVDAACVDRSLQAA